MENLFWNDPAEKKPEKCTDVLVAKVGYGSRYFYDVAHVKDGEFYIVSDEWGDIDITEDVKFWANIPNPPSNETRKPKPLGHTKNILPRCTEEMISSGTLDREQVMLYQKNFSNMMTSGNTDPFSTGHGSEKDILGAYEEYKESLMSDGRF